MNENIVLMSIRHLIKCIYTFGIRGFVFNYRFFKYKIKGISNRQKRIKCLHLKNDNNQTVYYRTNSSDIPLVHSILVWNGEYNVEIDESKFDAILDLGANIGLFSLQYCLRFPGKRLVAVEPEQDNYAIAEKNLTGFPRVDIVKSGIWWKPSKLKVENHGTDWSFTVREADETDYDTIGIDIDTICKKFGIENDRLFVKMDIEGTEEILFDHIDHAEWIDRTNYLIMEIHGDEKSDLYKKICMVMEKKGFNYTSRGENTFFIRNVLMKVQ